MSEIFVDTIRKTGGSLGTDIRIKNTSVYESDGGTSVTQNIVKSLVKQWTYYDHPNATVKSSFNTSSITDVGTGSGRVNMTSPYASFDDYGANFHGNAYTGNSWNTNTENSKMNWNTTNSGSLYDFASYSDGVSSYQDSTYAYLLSYGDLA